MKAFELSIEERDNLCRVLEYAMEQVSNSNRAYTTGNDFLWTNPEAEQEYAEMKALKERLLPQKVPRSGWVREVDIWTNEPTADEAEGFGFVHVVWEDEE